MLANSSRIAEGRLAVTAAANAGTTLTAGIRRILTLHAIIVPGAKATTTPGTWTNTVEFLDFPVKRQPVENYALDLPAAYLGIRIVVTPPPPVTPRLTEVRRVAGTLEFLAEGFTAGSITLEVSENLRDWAPIPLERTPDGAITVPLETGAPARFYRLVAR